jgi:hypothetical protein
MHALSNFSVPASALETAGKQDEVSRDEMAKDLSQLGHVEAEQ